MYITQLHNSQSLKLHFKKWSNKGYAAFCSIGKVVHISKLAVSLVQWIGNVVELVEETLYTCIQKEADEAAEELQELVMLSIIPTTTSIEIECRKSILIKNINCR